MIQELQEFTTNVASGKDGPEPSPFQHIQEECRDMKDTLLVQSMNSSIQSFLELVRQNWDSNIKEKAFIYPIILQEDQESDLQIYLKRFYDILVDKIIGKKVIKKKCDEPLFTGLNLDDIFIQDVSGCDVRSITLDIYLDSMNQGKDIPEMKLNIYIVTNVTDLSEQNMYVFSKGITNKIFIAFVPTFETFEDDSYEGVDRLRYQKYHQKMYNSKHLFAQYLYECIISDKIRAYLPPEVLSLITDMDAYPLGYQESCRRLEYCIIRSYQIYPKERPKIDVQKLITFLILVIKKGLQYKMIYDPKEELLKFIKVLLSPEQKYTFSSRVIASEVAFGLVKQSKHKWSQNDVIENIKDQIVEQLNGNLSQYAQYFLQEEELSSKKLRSRKKYDRMALLGIKKNLNPKAKLQSQITNLIRIASYEIRQFSSHIKWSSIKFEERIKPQIPMKIVKAMKEDEETRELTEKITSCYSKPLSVLYKQFDSDEPGEGGLGWGGYQLRTAELSGLITLSRRYVNPIVYNNFFEKSSFQRKK